MTAPVYYHSPLTEAQAGKPFTFTGSEAHHACVMRVGAGETIHLVDGQGTRLIGQVQATGDKSVTVLVEEVYVEPQPRPQTILVQALAKGGRDEQAIESATEVGIDRVIAWQSQRAIVRWEGKKQAKNLEKWQHLLKAAAKQSRRARIPSASFAQSTAQLLQQLGGARLLVLHESGEETLQQVPADWFGADEIALIVGPEGGITDSELESLATAGARIVRIGNTVMRSSTAGTVALALVNYLSGRYNQN